MRKNKVVMCSLLLLAASALFVSCSKDNDSEDTNGTEQPQEPQEPEQPEEPQGPVKSEEEIIADSIAAVKARLCEDCKFVVRQTRDGYWSDNYFFAPVLVTQINYKFYADGTGEILEHHTNKTDRGYSDNKKEFQWSLSNTLPITLSVTAQGMHEKFDEVQIDSKYLTYKGGMMDRELIYKGGGTFNKEDIISYYVQNLYTWTEKTVSRDGDLGYYCFFTPSMLTVNTKQGVYRFFRECMSSIALGQMISFAYDTPKEKAYIYYQLSFEESSYSCVVTEEEKTFTWTNSRDYYFYIGDILWRTGEYYAFTVQNDEELEVKN